MRFSVTMMTAACAMVFAAATVDAQETRERGERRQPQHADEHAHKGKKVEQAVAVLVPVGNEKIRGLIRFTQRGEGVEITGKIVGLTPGKHGFHVHEFGDLTDLDTGKSAGDHFNPEGKEHGRPDSKQRHVGDLGNIEADEQGVATIEIRDSLIKLNGAHSVLGRAVVVHAKPDQFTQPSGDAGDRVAVGVIGVAQPERVREARQRE